ncbi:hypothetical protein M513_13676 [Trichuris suis]|uniref:CCHC-type domain-containing protein n=1 Tax=Trichuris suis TaxID=68888 RepID=A0A085LKE8_9BILA|nr:hypothetical protein M513_13676 [Trichuris suis]
MGAPASLVDNRFNGDPILSQSMASDYWISGLEDREAIITDQYRASSGIDPALGVEPYDGDPRKWDMFIGSFRALVHDVMPSDAIRIAYLRKLLSPQVRDSVATYLYNNPALYHQAVRRLKHRYGDRRLIAQYSVKALRNIKPLRHEDVAELDRFACELHGITTSLSKTGDELELYSAGNLHDVVAKLTYRLRERWLESARRMSRQVNLLDLDEWLSELVLTKRSAAVFEVSDDKPDQRLVRSKAYGKSRVNTVTSAPDKIVLSCVHCRQCHHLQHCAQFNVLPVQERIYIVKKSKLCFSCLEGGHVARNCKKRKICGIDGCTRGHVARNCKKRKICGIDGCTRKHHNLLHSWAQVTPVSAQSSHVGQPEKAAKLTHVGATSRVPNSTVLLSVVPVCVHGSTSSSLTYALLDPGSEATLITEEMANKLGLTRKKSTVRLATFYGSVPITTSAMVSFQVSATDGMYTVHVENAITVPGLNLSQRTMDWPQLKWKWSHLNEIPLSKVDYGSVSVLLGADVIDVH